MVECDPCQNDDPEKLTPARTRRVVIDGIAYEIDVCPFHAQAIDALAVNLAEIGRKSKMTKGEAPSEAISCPACDDVFSTKGALNAHTRDKHGGITAAELRGTATLKCPVKGCTRAFELPQGLAVHQRLVHGPPTKRARSGGSGQKAA